MFYSKLLLQRSVMYTRCIDSNLESGRYISRVGRASRFLSLITVPYYALDMLTYAIGFFYSSLITRVPWDLNLDEYGGRALVRRRLENWLRL